MTVTHHVSDELLLSYCAGRLRPALALVVESHLELCPEAAALASRLDMLGATLMTELPPADLTPELFERTLARLDEARPPRPRALDRPIRVDLGRDLRMPRALARRRVGPWRWMGPGMHFSRVEMDEDPGASVLLFRIEAGRALPAHGHAGQELTLVLKGAFSDASGVYRAGDIAEDDESDTHQPRVDESGECICLAAFEGRLKLDSLMGRLMQPLLGL